MKLQAPLSERLAGLPEELWLVTVELAPWLLLGAAVAGLLHVALPPGFIDRQLRGYAGVVKSVVLGVPLPLCSCGVIPAGIGLKKSGASDGAAMGFLIATPQTGVDSTLVAAGFLGWPFALYKVGAALLTGVVGGSLVEAGSRRGAVVVEAAPPAHADRSWQAGLAHAVDLVRMIWRWLVFGIAVSALLTLLVPAGALADAAAGSAALAFFLVLAASVPLYVCATASVPIAAALVHAGLPTGAALVFLMAGPATNVATLGAVYRGFGLRPLLTYLGTIITGSVVLGLLYEPLLGDLTPLQLGHHEHVAWWAQAAAVVLLASFLWFLWEDLQAMFRFFKSKTSTAATVELPVAGMTCGGCASRLERVLSKQEGVESAVVSYPDGTAVVSGLLDLARLREAVEGAGFEVSGEPRARSGPGPGAAAG